MNDCTDRDSCCGHYPCQQRQIKKITLGVSLWLDACLSVWDYLNHWFDPQSATTLKQPRKKTC